MSQIKFIVQGEELVIHLESTTEEEEMLHTTDEITQRVLVAKDSGLISDETFHELRMSLPEETTTVIPPINALKDERNGQNKIVDIHPIAEVRFCDISFLELLHERNLIIENITAASDDINATI